ncbi:MAG: antibiotic biosynthesis monooxygenase [Bryobacterales bacterium]|nr:antibiotic biosynthesis monooxygenase [Bryobacterales bacterium]
MSEPLLSEPLLTVVAEMTAQPGKADELRAALMACIEPTRAEAGCVDYILHESTDTPGQFVFYENWVSAEALAVHAKSPHLVKLGAQVPELVAGTPRILTYRRIA